MEERLKAILGNGTSFKLSVVVLIVGVAWMINSRFGQVEAR